MLTLFDAQTALLARIVPAQETESLPLAETLGRYTSAPISAQVDNPVFDNSAMDGYAFNYAEASAAGFVLPAQAVARCGDAPGQLVSGTAMRIFTGAPVPSGADTVVMQEQVTQAGARLQFPASAQPGENIRRRADDFQLGDLLYAPGHCLSAYDLALLSTAGVAQLSVYRRARVLVVATGDELVVPGRPLKPGQIYESNRLTTCLQLQNLGAQVTDAGTVGDDPAALRRLLMSAQGYDFVVTSGGASVGDHDVVKQVFAEIGEIHFWKVKIKPGKPIAFGRLGERGHFFALPGNPVSSLVTFKLFVEPALRAWHHNFAQPLELPALAANGFERRAGRTEFLRAHLSLQAGRLMAEALSGQGSHQLGTLRRTNGFIKLPEDSCGFKPGEQLAVMPLSLMLEGGSSQQR